MTFELSEKIIIEEQIPKDVELLADMENDLGTKDMDCVQYSAERKEICFTPRYYLDYSAYDEGIDHSKWSILCCGENCDFDRSYYSERICDLSDMLLRMQMRRKHAPHIMKLLKEEFGRRMEQRNEKGEVNAEKYVSG